MIAFDAWHLPGIDTADLTVKEYEFRDLRARAPELTARQLQAAISHIQIARRQYLAQKPVADIITAIDGAAARIADKHSPEGHMARALLPPATGYSAQNIEDVLRHMTRDWCRDSLMALVSAELGDSAALDGFVREDVAQRVTFARGPRLAFHVFSGNVPGVAVTSVVRSLLVKAATLGKTAAGEPVLPVLFARALAAVAPPLAQCLAITYWPGGTESLEDIALNVADTVVVYGSEETVRSITSRARPGTRVVEHGPRLSIGIVGPRATGNIAHDIAHATAAYDQQGCVSPHVVFVEIGGAVSPPNLARSIAAQLALLADRLPRGRLSPGEALAIRNARSRAEFRAIAGAQVQVFSSEDTSYTVIYDEDAALTTSCLNRLLYVCPIVSTEALLPLLESERHLMQSVALAGYSEEQIRSLALRLAECGVTRITSFAQLPWPPMTWHHDGKGGLHELLNWHDIEA